MTAKQNLAVMDDVPPWMDARAAYDLRDDADDFEDALIAEGKMTGLLCCSSHQSYG